MAKVAILGFGTVGTGVAEVLTSQADQLSSAAGEQLELGYILVRRDFPENPWSGKMIKDFSVIENDDSVRVVAEVIGGTDAAYEYSRRAILAGKSVVTSNKALVAERGLELTALAREHQVSYLFEGSVGGGIPLLRPLIQDLAANRIDEVCGIINGTTNYILSAMDEQEQTFPQALAKAQEMGYAEADPTADVEGMDACRKITILADLAFGGNLDPAAVPTVGITHLDRADLELSRSLGYTIKLLGRAIRTGDGCMVFVEPHLIPLDHTFASIHGVMNACAIRGSAVGQIIFCGPGAGRYPTASAVAADIVQAVHCKDSPVVPDLGKPHGRLVSPDGLLSPWYVRTGSEQDDIYRIFPHTKTVYSSRGECGFLTSPMSKQTLLARLNSLSVRTVCRVMAEKSETGMQGDQ